MIVGLVYFTRLVPKSDRRIILGMTPTKVHRIKGNKGSFVIPAAIENTLNGIIGRSLPMRTLHTPYFFAKSSALQI